ncbi:MAG: fibronectin type III domain-containing protein [Deltaproteobacteria bacterium]|nr:fibronectin type III domain-containing protein [Deltaproteobacteria bacterium]
MDFIPGSSSSVWPVRGGNVKTNGSCGTNNNAIISAKPITNLCSAGTATAVTGNGPWSWNCTGSVGGSDASCSAQLADITPPIISNLAARGITDTSAIITWTTSEPAKGSVFYGIAAPSTELKEAGFVNAHSIMLSGLSANSDYGVKVTAADAAANTSESAIITFRTAVSATTPPVILEGPTVSSISDTTAVITWKTDIPSTGTLSYGIGNTGQTRQDLTLAVNHSVTLAQLLPQSSYTLVLLVSNANGNNSLPSRAITFTTKAAPDNKAPIITQGPMALGISDSAATISWMTDEPSTSTVTLKSGNTTKTYDDLTPVVLHNIRVTGLSASTQYSYTVSSTDRFNNGPTISAQKSFFTIQTPDTTPPRIISGPSAQFISEKQASILWESDEKSDSQVEYGSDRNNLDKSAYDNDLLIRHSLQLNNLTKSTKYYYRIRTRDAVGNETVTEIRNFTTKDANIIEKLQFVDGPKIEFKDNSKAVLSWKTNKPADTWFAFGEKESDLFDVQAHGGENASGTEHRHHLPDLKSSTAYIIRCTSHDRDGQTVSAYITENKTSATSGIRTAAKTSAKSVSLAAGAPIALTTDALPDTTLPVITAGPTVTSASNTSATIQWTTNKIADSQVSCTSATQTIPLVFSEINQVSEHAMVLTNLTADIVYTCQVTSSDPAGNTQSSGSFSVTTTALPDNSLPTVTATPTMTLLGNGTAAISWNTSKAASSLIKYGADAAALNDTVSSFGVGTNHTMTLTNLTIGTIYSYVIEAMDPSGNTGISTPQMISLKTGDCDNTGSVNISEVQSAINMFLGLKQPAVCVDYDAAGNVSISKVQKAINSFLGL